MRVGDEPDGARRASFAVGLDADALEPRRWDM